MDYRRTLPFYMSYQGTDRTTYDQNFANVYGQSGPQNQYGAYSQPGSRNSYSAFAGLNRPGRNLPLYPFQQEMNDEQAMQDLDYLQEMYPADVKNYQRKIAEILDRMDYQGSLIYDDYPDRMQLVRLADEIVDMLKAEEPESTSPDKWVWLGDLILILLFYEIYRRRRMAGRGFRNF